MKTKFWQQMENHPPCLVRLMARRKEEERSKKAVVALTDEEIAMKADLPLSLVKAIYWEKNWDDVKFKHMRAFITGCGFDPTSSADRNRAQAYVNQPGGPQYIYLKKSPLWKTVFLPLIKHMKQDG
jgi:hypothetical protein